MEVCSISRDFLWNPSHSLVSEFNKTVGFGSSNWNCLLKEWCIRVLTQHFVSTSLSLRRKEKLKYFFTDKNACAFLDVSLGIYPHEIQVCHLLNHMLPLPLKNWTYYTSTSGWKHSRVVANGQTHGSFAFVTGKKTCHVLQWLACASEPC